MREKKLYKCYMKNKILFEIPHNATKLSSRNFQEHVDGQCPCPLARKLNL